MLIHPPLLNINISSTIGFKEGSFGNNVTTGRKISREHMATHEGFSTYRALLFEGTNYAFCSIRM